MLLTPTERAGLRQFLIDRFSLNELKDLAFDLGVDFELFSHQTKLDFSRELIAHFERRDRLGCLVTDILKRRQGDDLALLLAKLPKCSSARKIQIIVSEDLLEDVSGLLDELAKRLKVAKNEVVLIGAAWGSVRLLVGVPEKATDLDILSGIRSLGNGKYQIVSIDAFASLDSASQNAWRLAAHDWPPIRQGKALRPRVSWEDALKAVSRTPFALARAPFGRLGPWFWGLAVAGGLLLFGFAIRYVYSRIPATPTPTSTPKQPPVATLVPLAPMPSGTATASATPLPSNTPSLTPSDTASPSPSSTVTPSVTPSLTPSDTASPAPSKTLTPSATPSLTLVPKAGTPELIAPFFGSENQNPIKFEWHGFLMSGEAYKVTVYHLKSRHTIQSGRLTTQQWTTNLPLERFGEWRWWVAVVRDEGTVVNSSEWMFWFQPYPGTREPTPSPSVMPFGTVTGGPPPIPSPSFTPSVTPP